MNKRVLGIVALSLLVVNFVSVSFTVQVSMAGNPPTIPDDNSSLQNDRVVLSDRAKNLTEPEGSNGRGTEWNFSSPDEWSKVAYADGNKTRLIVGVNEENDVSLTELEEIAARHDARIVNTVTIRGRTHAVVVELMFTSVPRFVQETQLAGLADYIEPNLKVKVSLTPNDPYWSLQWGPKKIEADWAWNTTVGDSDLLVAVIDTGIDYNHPDLAANYVPLGYDWVNNDPDPRDDYGHGTHCAGIIAAAMNNNVGIAGVAQVKIMAEKVIDNGGWGYADWFAEGVINATDSGAKILSISLGGYGDSELMHDSLKYAYDAGVLIVAAAANDNSNIKPYPAGYSEVVAVAATDQNDQKASFSNWGDWIELSAPGVSVYSTMPTYSVTLNGYGYSMNYDYLSGTSMACPHVAGVAALVWSRFPGKSRDWARLWLRSTSDDFGTPGFDVYYGYGRVNARRAVEYATAQHELEAFSMAAPLYVRPEEQGIINSTVFNFGESDETDVTVQLWANDTIVSAETIGYLATGEFATVSLPWSPTVQGIYNVTAYVVPVAGEARLDNNAILKYVYVGNPVKTVVLHSSGNALSQSISTWQELNSQWHLFGDTMIYVDYTSLNKDDISYADLAGSEADVLIISCAYDRYAGWEFTDSEIKAITRYVYEGHGLIATAGTLYNGVPNNNKLAPLFGIDDTVMWNTAGTDLLHLLNTTHPLFAKVPNPLVFPLVGTALPSDGQWDSNELVGGKYLGLGQNQESAIVTFRGLVYISPWLEVIPPYYYHHLQLLYNAITWSDYQKPQHELVASLDVPTRLKPGEYTLLNATVSNSGLSNETDVELKLFIDSTLVGNVAIPQLLVDSSYTLSYPWTPMVQGVYNVTEYAPPIAGEEFTEDNIVGKTVPVLLIAVRNVLVYSDDAFVAPSSRYVIVALTELGINHTYYSDDPWGFGSALVSQTWDLVIVDHYNYYALGNYWTELDEYVRNGGLLLLDTFDIDGSNSEPTTLWDTLGVRWVSDMWSPEPVYQWIPSHPIFTFPNTVGDITSYEYWGYVDYGDHVAVTTGTPIAGFVKSPMEEYAAVVVGNIYQTVLFSFDLDEFRHDEDGDGKLDAIELWQNAIVHLAKGSAHDLAVNLEAPTSLELGNSKLLNATVRNRGLNSETGGELYLLIDGTVVSNVTVPELLEGESYTTSYLWTPTRTGSYNVSAYAPPVAGEDQTQNNLMAKHVSVFFYTHWNRPGKWVGGGYPMDWHMDDSSREYALPFNFPFYGMSFDKIYISSNGLITFNAPDSSLGNSVPELARRLAIAPAWDDWVTYEPYDIYVRSNSTCVIIRWDVRHYGSNTEAQFESILWSDGVIEFDYLSNSEPFSATVGISNGEGHIIAEDIDNFGVESRVFLPYRRDVAVYDVQASPAEVYSGQPVSVNVTVGNEGEMQESFDVQVFCENLALNPNVRTSIISSPASPNEPHPGDAIWIEPSFVDLDGLGIGQKFNVTLWTNLTRASYLWQIDIIYNSERLGATRAEYTAGSSSQFYSGYATVPVAPDLGHACNDTHSGVMFGESLIGYSVERPAGFGSLCWIEFQILEKPYPEPADYFELARALTFACDPDLEEIPVTLFNGAYGSSTQPPPPPPPSNIIGTATVHLDPGTDTTILFTWNTLGLPLGNYTLRARAMPLAGETDLDDNNFTDGIVEILWRYDVAVIDLTTPVQFIYPGQNFTVDVTVQNNGDAAENVTIVAYFNASSNEILGEGELENLLPGESRTITLTADTKNVTAGHHYVLTAVAIIEEMDYNPSDNRLAGPTITIRFLGDINGDGKVDMKDIGVLARLFGIKAGDTNWNPDCDLNSDGKINLRDVAMAAKNFGKTMD
jgi:subtilisin family serine protease